MMMSKRWTAADPLLRVEVGDEKLTVALPRAVAPDRRYVTVKPHCVGIRLGEDRFEVVDLLVMEHEPFDKPAPGRYAWQGWPKDQATAEVRLERLICSEEEWARVVGRLGDTVVVPDRIAVRRVSHCELVVRVFRSAEDLHRWGNHRMVSCGFKGPELYLPQVAPPAATLDDVRRSLHELRGRHGPAAMMEVLRRFVPEGKQALLQHVPEPVYHAVISEALAFTPPPPSHGLPTASVHEVRTLIKEHEDRFGVGRTRELFLLHRPIHTPARRGALARALREALVGPKPQAPMNDPINCRCAGVETKINQETDMRKIDTTTAGDLPFGLFGGRSIIQAQFDDDGKSYAYFAEGDLDVAEGDYVTVVSPYGPGVFDEESGGYLKVLRVTGTQPSVEGITKAAKWIVGKVDMTGYRERRAKVEQAKVLDAQIAQAKREALKQLELKQLMELSPELAKLVEARLELSGIKLEEKAAEDPAPLG
jgi:hypothetical protein